MGNPLERRSFDIGWLVGIIDGEGCFTLNVKNTSLGKGYYPTVQITNTNDAIIKKAADVFRELGIAPYIYTRMPKTGKVYFRLEVAGLKRVKRFMDVFGPLFECRRHQCDTLRKYVDLRLSKTSHAPLTEAEHRLADELKQANNRTRESSETNTPDPLPGAEMIESALRPKGGEAGRNDQPAIA